MKPNQLRQLLNKGKPTLGTHVLTPWPGIVEVIGYSGAFDYIEYLGEYSPFSLELMDNLGRAIELFPEMSAMIKIDEQTRGFIAQRAIDSGIQNVLFADVRSAADARECVRLVRAESPNDRGVHGVAMRRNVGYVLEAGSRAWADSLRNVVIALMIEKKGAVDEIEAIVDVDGVDMVQFGPLDYSVTVGKISAWSDPEIEAAHRKVIQAALKAGKHPRVELGGLEHARPYLDMGVRHFCVGWDIQVVYQWGRQQADVARALGLRIAAPAGKTGYLAADE